MADSNILLSGLDEALNDAAVWRETFVIGDTTTGEPMSLVGRSFLITFRVLQSWAEVVTVGTGLGDGSLSITDAAAGSLSLVSLPAQRPYTVPLGNVGSLLYERSVRGDVLSWLTAKPAEPEYMGYIIFNLRASTTRVTP